tara:strand:- start:2864 stop:3382 length:519 start_codon:yes stop_codon:yes gene_type:complete
VFGAGEPVPTEVSDVGWGGLLIATAGDTGAAPDFQTPCIADPTEEIGVRVIWSIHAAGTADDDDVTWLVKYDQFDIGEVPVAAATALNTPIAEHRCGVTTRHSIHRTARGIINADTLDFTARQGGITWSAEADAMDYGANEIQFIALEIDYKPLLCVNTAEKVDVFKSLSAA